ncbi:MAG: hypothetical protein ABSH41_30575, partial [Syntrophobacteraceae bacterium]
MWQSQLTVFMRARLFKETRLTPALNTKPDSAPHNPAFRQGSVDVGRFSSVWDSMRDKAICSCTSR